MSDKYNPFDSPNTTDAIAYFLNQKWYSNLDNFLKEEVNWYAIDTTSILPRAKARAFVRSIRDREVRLAVMAFLDKYATDLFGEVEEHRLFMDTFGTDTPQNPNEFTIKELYDTLDNNLTMFRKELQFQSEMITSAGEFTGDKFKKQEEKIAELEKQVEELKAENEELFTQLEKYKHPSQNGKHIPEELNKEEFYNIMNYLVDHKIVRRVTERNEIGIPVLTCYQWDASKALFGYFVSRMNDVLNLRGARVQLNWKVFEPAINNYLEIVNEARKAFSTYNNSSVLQINRIEKVDIIDEAIKNRNGVVLPF